MVVAGGFVYLLSNLSVNTQFWDTKIATITLLENFLTPLKVSLH